MQDSLILIANSNADGLITVCDPVTGSQVSAYKGNGSPRNGLATLGNDYIVAAQVHKHALHFWSWQREQVLQRSFAAEALTCLACSPDGAYLAAGGASGTLYLWEVGSGRLMRAWAAHYKAATALLFVGSCGLLLSGGEDTLVHVWPLAQLLDPATAADPHSPAFARPAPLHAWSDHTLPVTALAVGAGEAAAVVASGSADRTVKLRRLGDGALLRAVALPAAVNDLVLDAGEQWLYAAGGDGAIYQVPLLAAADPAAAPAAAAAGTAGTAAAGGHDGASGSGSSGAAGLATFLGHSRSVTCLALAPARSGGAGAGATAGAGGAGPGAGGGSGSGGCDAVLVSGSEDGTVRVWDLRSRQPVQVISAPGKAAVTGVQVVSMARNWLPSSARGGGGGGGGAVVADAKGGAGTGSGGGRAGPKRPQPLAPLAKHPGVGGSGRRWEGAPVVVDGSTAWAGLASSGGGPDLAAPPRLAALQAALAAQPGLLGAGVCGGSAAALGQGHDSWEAALS
ncbi:hypothetical protein HXX76_011019 [Chlamydomonas incerta]|uniref:WD repeat-containing protein 54 beta-propeller domain-containing protein n=1 Tax=Chlamydomonas incerta TaxID=51695 RepID=A0A835VVB8_CHLIN|nr:hypothetical protein HXX76_011019 [Chlamydomonas incerta]|eukprot:KAG2429250.1 hypothetical protein HXX76_011019 [Chlamydomonas incerta]